MKKRRFWILGLVCLLIASATTVCSKVEAAETLHLGATLPFQSRLGIQMKNIFLMNADLINKSGGLTVGGKTYMIQYHIYDDKYDADTGRAACEKLVFEDKIKFNVGTFGSAPVLAMAGITEPNKVPIFTPAASEKILAPNLKYMVHCYCAKQAYGLMKALNEIRPEVKSVLICTADTETGHALSVTHERGYKSFGITPFPTLYYKQGETDFSRIAIKAVSLKPDIFHGMGITIGAEVVQLIKALRDAGYKGPIMSEYVTQEVLNDIVARVGKKGVEGLLVTSFDPTMLPENMKPPEAAALRSNYEKYYGKWETEGVQWVGNWYTWLAAVRKADSLDPDKVMAAIGKDFVVQTPEGPARFFTRPDLGNNRYCDYSKTVLTGIVKDGKIEFLFKRDPDFVIDAVEKVYGIKMR
jgi:ABC-type branched-subunit amino acid transport system substrate-binding protein